MSDQRWIKPADARRVRFPGTGKLLGPKGARVAWASYWERLLTAGDVVVFDPDAEADAVAAAKAKAAAPVADLTAKTGA
jgi:hypothetical protein